MGDDPAHPVLSKFRLPIGSIVIDIALIFTMLYGAGQITNEVENLAKRVGRLEESSVAMTPGAAAEISALKVGVSNNTRLAEGVREQAKEDHAETMRRLDRIEALLQQHMENSNGRSR